MSSLEKQLDNRRLFPGKGIIDLDTILDLEEKEISGLLISGSSP